VTRPLTPDELSKVLSDLEKLLAELPEFIADYRYLAADESGKIDPVRRRRALRMEALLFKIQRPR
jgi:hypothetical protein